MTPLERAAVQRDRILRARAWLIPSALFWIVLGAGTIHGYAGHPEDAPHLHIPEDLRGWAWIASGILAFGVLMADRRHEEEPTRLAASALLFMPLVRAVSYTWAWMLSVLGEDVTHLAPWYQEGSPSAWYACAPWWIISLAILTQAVNWRHIRRQVRRKMGRGVTA